MREALIIAMAVAIASCNPPPPQSNLGRVKPGASCEDYQRERYQCIQEARQPISRAYVGAYGGSSASSVAPSLGVYQSCMAARGWLIVQDGGCRPQDSVHFTD